MHSGVRLALPLLATVAILPLTTWGDEKQAEGGLPCARAVDNFFAEEVWAKVGAQSCLTCHKAGGDAEESQFVLLDPERSQGAEQEKALRHNRDAFARMARRKEGEQHRLLLKVAGGLDHGGEDVLKPDSTGYRILADFVRRVNAPPTAAPSPDV